MVADQDAELHIEMVVPQVDIAPRGVIDLDAHMAFIIFSTPNNVATLRGR